MPWMSCSSIRHAVKVELLLHNSPSPEEAQLLRRAQEVSAHTKITTIVPTLNYALICFDIRYAYLYMIYQWYYWMAGERDWRKQYLGHGRGGCTLHGYNVCARCMSLCSAARTFCCRWSPSRASNCDWKSGTLWTPLRCQNGEMQWNAMKCNEMQWNAMKCMENWVLFGLVLKFWMNSTLQSLQYVVQCTTVQRISMHFNAQRKHLAFLCRSWRDEQ
jgi:hypothetical protein